MKLTWFEEIFEEYDQLASWSLCSFYSLINQLYSSTFKKHSSPSPINDGRYHLLLQSLYNILKLIHDI
ncbi:hypothetical protein LVR01_05610, partial [Streptococcus pseudopneumoniae]|nr:hypothetical protein [Streptococcus pseudopneumoniae]